MGYVILFFLIDPISKAVLKLGPTEMLLVAVWGLTLIASLGGQSLARGLLAGLIGVLIGTIGMNARGDIRGTFGLIALLDGVPAIPALIGMFAASELFNLMGTKYIVGDSEARRLNFYRIVNGVGKIFRYLGVLVRGSIIGVFVGAIPGVGSSVSNLVSYAETRRVARDRKSFGTGNPKGVVAAESANSSSEGGSMVTLLALGIPGGAGTAVLLGAFAMHNITGGPRFIIQNKDIVYALIFGNFLQAGLLVFLGLGFIFVSTSIVKVPVRILIPSVLALTTLGGYTLTGNMVGPFTVLVFAILGWLLRRYDYPVAATVIGLLLGRMIEGELLRSYQISAGHFSYILHRPISLVIVCFLLLSLMYPVISQIWRSRVATHHD
jgi:putative tricarboxylic transport membrane protein